MYTLTFRHPKGDSVLTWDLETPDDTVLFTNYDGQMAKGFTLKGSSEGLTIRRGSASLLELTFLESNVLYILRLMQGGNIIREFYLSEDELTDEQDFTIDYSAE